MLFRERMVPALHVKSDQDQGTQRATRRAGATRCSRCCHRSPLRPASTASQQRGQDPARTACAAGPARPRRQAGRATAQLGRRGPASSRRAAGGLEPRARRPAHGDSAGATQICGPHWGLAGHSPVLAPERAGSGAPARGAGTDGPSAARAVVAVRQRPAHSAQRPARAAARQACRGRTEA